MHGRNADEFLLMVQHGMTPMAAIVAATVNAADLLGLAAEIGTIEPGKIADIVAVRGDPLRRRRRAAADELRHGPRPGPSTGALNASIASTAGDDRTEDDRMTFARPPPVPARLAPRPARSRSPAAPGWRRARETAAARALYDSIFEGMLRASPEIATGLGLDTGERAYLQEPAQRFRRRPARWAATGRCSSICRSCAGSTAPALPGRERAWLDTVLWLGERMTEAAHLPLRRDRRLSRSPT